MQKAGKAFFTVAGGVLFIGFSIQIVLGLCWMVCNFPGYQQFGESALYVEISKSFICDEYEGILYPVLIWLARGIEDFFLIPYHYILYLLQLCMAFAAAYRLLRSAGVKGKAATVWGSLAMLTFPMAMQCHLAVLPDSLTSSFLLLELSFAFDMLRQGGELRSRQLIKVLAFWLLAALMQPVYLYLGAVTVIFLFLFGMAKSWKANKKKILYNGIMILAFAGMISGVQDLTQVEGYYGRVHQSLNASLMSRCAWLYAEYGYELWPREAKEAVPWEQVVQVSYYADNVERMLAIPIEEAVGEERAEEIFGEVAQIAWEHHKSKILHDAAWDVVGYTFSPMVLQRQLTGKAYDSYSGRNYDIMRAGMPQLTEYFLNYSCWWFAAGLCVAGAVQAAVIGKAFYGAWRRKGSLTFHGGKVLSVLICLFTSGVLVLLYSLRGAGMMDYKKSIAVTLLWLLWALLSCTRGIIRRE